MTRDEIAEMNRQMGITTHAVKMPERKADGTFVVPTVPPAELRAWIEKNKKLRTSGPASQQLTGREKEEIDRGMGMHRHAVKMPERKEDGTFVVHTVRPSDLRKHLARKAG